MKDEHGRTALHWACVVGNVQMVKRLNELGAIITKDKEGMTPINLAQQNNHHTIAEELLDRSTILI